MSQAAWELTRAEQVFDAPPEAALCIVGRRERLLDETTLRLLPEELRPILAEILREVAPDDRGGATSTWIGSPAPRPVHVGVLSREASRHDAPTRPDHLTQLLRPLAESRSRPLNVLVACGGEDEVLGYALAATRAFPRYERRSEGRARHGVRIAFATAGSTTPRAQPIEILRDAVADAMEWQDRPCEELDADAFVDLARRRADEVGARCRVLRGEALAEAGLAGIAAVGRAARGAPALVALTRAPAEGADTTRGVAWVGKGVVFDSGGLSLKRPDEMRGMKGDMGGAGAVLAAFGAAVRLGAPGPLHAVLCIAENAVGPGALRPDDIVTLHSGKSVEVVDTDCEGRILLADGCSWAAAELAPRIIVDLATLTDAAPVSTGALHAAVVCNDGRLEDAAVAAGRSIGDLVHPMPYLPELTRPALASPVADLRNASASKALGVSTAAQFIGEHLTGFDGSWLHVDMEGTARSASGRATGFGVGLLLRTFGHV